MSRLAGAAVPARAIAAAPCPETLLAVPGMRCAGCIAKLEQGLAGRQGIVSARVDFGAQQLRIVHLPDVSPPELAAAVEALGFEAQPLVAGARAQSNEGEVRPLLRALGVAAFAAMNVMLLSVAVWSGAAGASRDLFHWLSALIAVPAILYAGRPFFRSGLSALRRGRTNMDVPISIGVTLATGLSLYETATHGRHAWFDGAIMLLAFLLAGRVLDATMRDRARRGAGALMAAMPAGAMVLDDSGLAGWRDSADLLPGARMLVAAGERLATDGVVETGASRIDNALFSGESAPLPVAGGAVVHAGTLNLDAPLTVRVTAQPGDRSVDAVARAMADAGQHRSRYVRIADRAARYYAPAVHALALAALAGWLAAGAGFHAAITIAIAVLIVTCPCALGLAVPAAQVVAAGALMRRGVLVKDGSALERLAEADRVLFDKTGTLTLGAPRPTQPEALPAEDAGIALALAQASRHPLARGLARGLAAIGVRPASLSEFEETPGEGIRARWQGRWVALRRARTASPGAGLLATALAIEGRPDRLVPLADPLRPDAREAVERLAAMGLPGSILSGDAAAPVAEAARALGLTAQCRAGPLAKQEAIARLQAAGAHVLMVGDGLNDGPALAAAHVSMAPAGASDVGQQAADLVFMGERLGAVADAVRVARATRAVVQQNFALAIGYNVLAIPLAFAGLVTPLIAAAAMSLSSLIVIGNALRLARA